MEKVEIFCLFLNRGVEKIVVIDLFGFGDIWLGDVEWMIKVFVEDIDFILFICKLNVIGDFWG